MKEYRAYVKNHCLWILWVAILGSIGLWLLGWTNHITGWLWGMMTHGIYFLYLVLQTRRISQISLEDVKRKVWIAVISRFSLIVVLVGIGTQIPSLSMKGVLGGVFIFVPLQYMEYTMYTRKQ